MYWLYCTLLCISHVLSAKSVSEAVGLPLPCSILISSKLKGFQRNVKNKLHQHARGTDTSCIVVLSCCLRLRALQCPYSRLSRLYTGFIPPVPGEAWHRNSIVATGSGLSESPRQWSLCEWSCCTAWHWAYQAKELDWCRLTETGCKIVCDCLNCILRYKTCLGRSNEPVRLPVHFELLWHCGLTCHRSLSTYFHVFPPLEHSMHCRCKAKQLLAAQKYPSGTELPGTSQARGNPGNAESRDIRSRKTLETWQFKTIQNHTHTQSDTYIDTYI